MRSDADILNDALAVRERVRKMETGVHRRPQGAPGGMGRNTGAMTLTPIPPASYVSGHIAMRVRADVVYFATDGAGLTDFEVGRPIFKVGPRWRPVVRQRFLSFGGDVILEARPSGFIVPLTAAPGADTIVLQLGYPIG